MAPPMAVSAGLGGGRQSAGAHQHTRDANGVKQRHDWFVERLNTINHPMVCSVKFAA